MEKAVFELNEKLKHPSDIEHKIDSILTRCRSENTKQLEKKRTGYLSEINTIRNSFTNLKDVQKAVNDLCEYKKQCEKMLQSNKYAINEYKTITQIAFAHQNFSRAKCFLEKLSSEDEDINDENLEEYANMVYEKDEFACDLKQYSYDLNNDEAKIVNRKIDQIKRLSLELTSTILQIATEFCDNADLVGAIDRIIMKEEKRDSVVRKVKEGETSEDPILKQYYLEHTRYINFEPKNFQDRFASGLKSGIKSKFEKLKGEKDFLARLGFIFDDLRKVKERNMSFFTFDDFLCEYHSALKKFFDQKLNDMEPEDILGLIEFKSYYYATIQNEFSRIPESIGPRLIENESELLQKYSEVASSKLKGWIDNISTIEIQKFMSRDPEINRDEQGKPVSSGFINLLQIIRAQLEPISFNKRIFLFLTGVIKEKCTAFKENIYMALQAELKNVYEGKGLHGFEDYCIMFGNSGLRLTQYISTLSFFQSDEVRELQQIFLGILKNSNVVLCEYIIFTCKPALSNILTDEWQRKELRQVFIVTLDDFLQDYQKMMSDYMFTTLICELCTKIYDVYKKALRSSKIPLTYKISESIKNDVEKLSELFKKYVNEDDFKDYVSLSLKFCPLIEAVSGELFIVEVKSLILSDPEISASFIENLLTRKTDIDENEKNIATSALPGLFSSKKPKRKTMVSKLLNK
ncbi:uncharacterized protein VICG_00450 [Vittaforma corneae ATCC 50505]|uniref:Uncharacterized protein n=1 Tax=Vittaforma corneae (strain ATCC 50505) TaxID=993615 RepID=L2GPV2_VITCO|nr:uncharacterized protein VICG_00450 [Vittaforma corneae ATCC 50505]ELA42352.1 hypothetical protein VICG_00450 [Vittaforma corneae ATCC 50505]